MLEKMPDEKNGLKNKFDPGLHKAFEKASDQNKNWFDEGLSLTLNS